jgi:hypothetical protein
MLTPSQISASLPCTLPSASIQVSFSWDDCRDTLLYGNFGCTIGYIYQGCDTGRMYALTWSCKNTLRQYHLGLLRRIIAMKFRPP